MPLWVTSLALSPIGSGQVLSAGKGPATDECETTATTTSDAIRLILWRHEAEHTNAKTIYYVIDEATRWCAFGAAFDHDHAYAITTIYGKRIEEVEGIKIEHLGGGRTHWRVQVTIPRGHQITNHYLVKVRLSNRGNPHVRLLGKIADLNGVEVIYI